MCDDRSSERAARPPRIDAAAIRAGWGQRRIDFPAWAGDEPRSLIPGLAATGMSGGFWEEAVLRVEHATYSGGVFDEDCTRSFAAHLLSDIFAVACEHGLSTWEIDEAVDIGAVVMALYAHTPPLDVTAQGPPTPEVSGRSRCGVAGASEADPR